MRRHFHRCRHLRVVSVEASELSGERRGGAVILDELCDAQQLTSCVGLVECEILSDREKRELLVVRGVRMREEEGRALPLAGASERRAAELEAFRDELLEERATLIEHNRSLIAEETFAIDARGSEDPTERSELTGRGVSLRIDDALGRLAVARLDAIDRAFEAIAHGRYGLCVACGTEIAIARLRLAPDARVCAGCADKAAPPS